MPIAAMRDLLKHAEENRYAVGYFESWNLESLLAVKDAAERMKSPVIIGFGGMFLGNPRRKTEENICHYGALAKSVAENCTVPVAVLLNEADRMDMLIRGMNAGFNAVMFQDPGVSFEETVEINRYLVRTAHYLGVDVEAEVGELPCADISTGKMTGGAGTDPDQAEYFVRETGADAIAIAAGNVHLLEDSKAQLDFELIKRLRKRLKASLVLHGGTGLASEEIKEAISLGISKINVGTALKRAYISSFAEYFSNSGLESEDPHEIVGRGGSRDMLCAAREAVAERVGVFMKQFGSAGMALK